MRTTEQLQKLLSVAERAQQPLVYIQFSEQFRDKFDPTTCAELVRRLMSAEAEVVRLRRGEFTPQEFQDLCHNKSVQDGFEAFADGCEAYQQKLFGRCRTKEQV